LLLSALLVSSTAMAEGESGVRIHGNVYGGGNQADVKTNTAVNMSAGAVKGNVYGGGNLGDVGTITKNTTDYNYIWKKTDGTTANTAGNNTITGTNTNTGICTVNISGGTIGAEGKSTANHASGHVFGAGKGSEDTWWCEKAIAYATSVSISDGTVFGNVYGGGQVGRVEDDAKVVIGTAGTPASGTEGEEGYVPADPGSGPDIRGDVFGAGAGLHTHGYSALVRGNSDVTVQGTAQVGGSVYGGGEIASVGRFTVVGGLPKHPDSGGYCTVTIQDNAKIGTSETGHNVYGACKGVTPAYNNTVGDANRSKSMQLLTNAPKDDSLWSHYNDDESSPFIWRYYKTEQDYLDFLKTLALTSHPHVTISENATVYGSVYGGGQRGVTLGNVDVDITGGTIEQDVYGGGALADTNCSNWDEDDYTEVTTLTAGESSVTGLYTLSGTTYTIIDTEAKAVDGTTYYSKGKWADASLTTAKYTTTVDLTGGLIKGDAYGGGLGQKTGFNSATSNIEAVVWGDIAVTLDGTAFNINYYTDEGYTDVVKSGRVFGCNNLLGSPQGNVTVTVNQTVEGNTPRTEYDEENDIDKRKSETETDHSYELAAVYGGGNLAPYEPPTSGKKAHVIINGCDATSILTVYGGGNAAPVPETDVDVISCFEIGSVFGGGNGKDKYKKGSTWETNPGADVNGQANTIIYGGTVHEAYGASNEKGTIHGDVVIDVSNTLPTGGTSTCPLDVAKIVGAGKNADVNGDLIMVMGCKPATKIPVLYAGADNANVNGDVELTITSGNFGQVFGGNNENGAIMGHIKLNIEETGDCGTPITIDELYLGGNQAAYSQYGYYQPTDPTTNEPQTDPDTGKPVYLPRTAEMADPDNDEYKPSVTSVSGSEIRKTAPYDAPVLNVISCTYIGEVFGGGLGETAIIYGDPTVNINMEPGSQARKIDRNGDGEADNNANILGEIGDVFGGGDAAAVYGNTTVNIGTATTVQMTSVKDPDTGVLLATQPKHTVTGAYITGNVYGGGKLADVGKTHLETEGTTTTDVVDIVGSTAVNICAVKGAEILDEQNNGTGRYNYSSVSFAEGAPGVTILGNVYGGGKGEAADPGTGTLDGAFRCGKAMVTESTSVAIGNGTIGDGTGVHGNVYGGGEVGRVEENTVVTIGCENDASSAPVIRGNVFGAGAGKNTHGYSALVRGNSYVTVQGKAEVKKSVYGGGEIASVGKYNVDAQGMPHSLANQGSGYCTVVVRDNAVIGPDETMLMTTAGGPDDYGHVFGAGMGVLPYEGYEDDVAAWRVKPDNTKQIYLSKDDATDSKEATYLKYVETLGLATQTYVTIDGNAFVKGSVYGGSMNGYVQHDTQVNIKGNCQIGSGYVQMTDDGIYLDKLATPVTRMGVNRRYSNAEWTAGHLIPNSTDEPELYALVNDKYYTTSLPECASWEYGQAAVADRYAPWDKYADTAEYDSKGGRSTGDDGHTFYGNVFGGGSGVIPYRPGKWHPEAGSVAGNTVVNVTGGHILTNIYGGNELTDVYGTCTVNFGGTATLGVPRTLKQIDAHPVTCYLFGAGKGDQRVLFNKSTNVKDVEVNITGGTIYGSVFGGGEDGHVLRDVTMTIGKAATAAEGEEGQEGYKPAVPASGPTIGTWGTSDVDGNIFGGGRGFGGDAYTAGNIAGTVTMTINGGSILGSIYGGGRLGSVGYGLFDAETDGEPTPGYGQMRADTDTETGFTDGTSNFFTNGRGHIDITISGGTIGNDYEYIVPNATNITAAGIAETDISKWTATEWSTWKTYHHISKTEFDTATGRLTHTKGGNVFAGGMGRFYQLDGTTPISSVDWWKLGNVKSTKLTITGGNIKSSVYGGGELGMVQVTHTTEDSKAVSTEVTVNGGVIGTEVEDGGTVKYTYGSVFGGGYGSLLEKLTHTSSSDPYVSYPKYIAGRVKGSTAVTISGSAAVKASVYGGGEMAAVGESKVLYTSADQVLGETLTGEGGNPMVANTYVTISGGTIGKAKDTENNIYYGGAKMGNVYGGGSGYHNTVRSGHIYGNTNVSISGGTIYHNIYGGGAYGTVGDFTYETRPEDGAPKVYGVNGLHSGRTGTGTANVTITGGTIGYDGRENGMVFGSSRGDINRPGERDDHTAWTYETHVTIGTPAVPASGTEGEEGYVPAVAASGPAIKGTVYGSGENGHVFHDTYVTVNGGTIGIADSSDPGYTVTSGGTTYSGAAYPYRGNVYGGGCGTDKYDSDNDGIDDAYNPMAGVVYGNTTVNIHGGQVVRNVYGAGAMGSVGKATTANDVTTVSGGTTTINVSGGTVGVDGTNGDGNVFGAARGDASATINQFALVRKSTNVSVTGGTIKGDVYGGGELGSVGTFTVSNDMRTFTWTDTDGTDNAANNEKNTGVCHVTVNGSSAAINGKVFGAGKGLDDTFWCEKGIAYSTKVNIVEGTVTGNVYGGGEVGRVETDSDVKIGDDDGTAEGTSTPSIMGSVFGGGAGVETHGYSALVRGNTTVTVEGNASVAHSVYGGGEIASVGKYGLDAQKMPSILQGGGYCNVTVRGHANIAEDVFGAGQGVTPHFDNDNDDHSKRSRRMTVYNSTDFPDSSGPNGSGTWEYYEDYPNDYSGTKFVWDYYQTSESYSTYLETLALATHPEVTIDGDATVNGSVFGGGELGLTKGSVIVKIKGGTIAEDVYGGGSLANTNTTSTVDLDGDGETETVHPTTTVNLTGGTINRNVYGGGLGRLAKDAVAAQGTEGEAGYVPAQPAVEAIAAKVYGDVLVELNKTTDTDNCVVKGNIFGCNNLNGSPQAGVTVHVYKTADYAGHEKDASKSNSKFNVNAVYGGGNLAAFYPDDATTRATAKANVIIDGCDLTSIGTVYGGGNAASVPETDVVINSAYEIGQAFGGGNGADEYAIDGKTYENPGANVGYMSYAYHTWDDTANKYIAYEYTTADGTDKDASTKDKRKTNYGTGYGEGKAHVTVFGGTVHAVYGGSNSKGNIRVESRTTLEDHEECDFNVGEAYGGGHNAPQDGDAVLEIGCISGLGKAYGGAANADVNGNVVLNITNGTYGQVFGGNDAGGAIRGSITVNIEETGCRPVIIGELYGGGCNAAYSVYGYDATGKVLTSGESPVADPQVNVKSFTSIGNIYGGGYGATATMVGNPTVNINVTKGKYAETYNGSDNVVADNKTVHGYPVPSHAKGAIGAINNVYGGGNAAEVIGTPHVNIGTLTGEVISLVTNPIEDSEGKTPSETDWVPSYQIAKAEGIDIRGNVFGGGNAAEVTGNTDVVIGKNNGVKTYSFTSYSAAEDGTAWSSGLAQTTGVTKNDLSEVVILTNGKYSDFVGQKYYVSPTATADGSARTELKDASGVSTGLYVAIKPYEQKTYTFTSYSAASGGTQYSTGTAAPTGNFKTLGDKDYMQIVVLTNPGEASWVGKTFYVPIDAETDGTSRYQLRKADDTTESVWVSIGNE